MLENVEEIDVPAVEARLGYIFKAKPLLKEALIHPSIQKTDITNQRLEILGDSVLNLIVTSLLFERFDDDEGFLSKMRVSFVDAEACYNYAKMLGLEEWIVVGKSVVLSWHRHEKSALSDLIESIFGAIYKDGGFEAAMDVFISHFLHLFDDICNEPPRESYREQLQHILQQEGLFDRLEYKIYDSTGPEHEKQFDAVVLFDKKEIGKGKGSSKKNAKEDAAEKALSSIMDFDIEELRRNMHDDGGDQAS